MRDQSRVHRGAINRNEELMRAIRSNLVVQEVRVKAAMTTPGRRRVPWRPRVKVHLPPSLRSQLAAARLRALASLVSPGLT